MESCYLDDFIFNFILLVPFWKTHFHIGLTLVVQPKASDSPRWSRVQGPTPFHHTTLTSTEVSLPIFLDLKPKPDSSMVGCIPALALTQTLGSRKSLMLSGTFLLFIEQLSWQILRIWHWTRYFTYGKIITNFLKMMGTLGTLMISLDPLNLPQRLVQLFSLFHK